MKILCYSVRLKRLESISDKAFLVEDFNGNVDFVPKSQVFGYDLDVSKSEAFWLSKWILEKKAITYSKKKSAFYNDRTGQFEPLIFIEKIIPKTVDFEKMEPNADLIR